MSAAPGAIGIVRASGLAPDPRFPLAAPELRGLLAVVLSAMGMEEAAFTLRLVGDREMALLNGEFLGCTGPTNVLSFPAETEEDDAEAGAGLGEIALSVDTLAREAELYGQDPALHTARLLAHAVLHLAGFDHGPEMDMLTEAAVDAVEAAGFSGDAR